MESFPVIDGVVFLICLIAIPLAGWFISELLIDYDDIKYDFFVKEYFGYLDFKKMKREERLISLSK